MSELRQSPWFTDVRSCSCYYYHDPSCSRVSNCLASGKFISVSLTSVSSLEKWNKSHANFVSVQQDEAKVLWPFSSLSDMLMYLEMWLSLPCVLVLLEKSLIPDGTHFPLFCFQRSIKTKQNCLGLKPFMSIDWTSVKWQFLLRLWHLQC